jgi:hypothetical protein
MVTGDVDERQTIRCDFAENATAFHEMAQGLLGYG